MAEIKNWETQETIFKTEGKNLKETLELAIKENIDLESANLENANLVDANLENAFLWNANLENANLENANLTNANLENANLENANLEKANLTNAILKIANLKNAYLWNANLENTNLESANLGKANLGKANLKNANLKSADLGNAYLWNAYLWKANLKIATLWKAKLINANLESANLESAFLRKANLINAKLGKANLENANLENANLENANLISANLESANLENANLENAILWKTNLKNAYLKNAYLKNANLKNANLVDANLVDANLENAYLENANLTLAKTSKTNFDGCELNQTIFGLMKLDEAINLNKVIVEGKCIIDFETLKQSPHLPKSFLKKIGLPDLYVDYLPDFYDNNALNLHPVFLSHSSVNKPFARKLYEALIDKGVLVWFDEKKLMAGDRIYESLSRSIDNYDKMILVCSEEALQSKWVIRELRKARKKEERLFKDTGKELDVLVPISIDGHLFKWENENRDFITERIVEDFSDWQDNTKFNKKVDKLVQALKADRRDDKPPSLFKA